MSKIDIQTRHLKLMAERTADADRDRPDIMIWVEKNDEDVPIVVVTIAALWGQGARYLDLSQDEARDLAMLLTEVADDLDLLAWSAKAIAHD